MFGSKTVLIIGLVILVFLSIALGKELLRRYEINQEISGLEEEIAQLEQKNLDLDDLMVYFDTNSFTEKEARQKLGLQKEGETMVIIGENLNSNQEIVVETSQSTAAQSANPEKWWNYFFYKQ